MVRINVDGIGGEDMDKLMENTYINIQSWMVAELGLKNNELIIYAIIYGFCQDGQSRFRGGRSYLAKWTNSTTRGVQKNLNSMIEKGLIAKEERIVNGVKACEYYPINLPWENASREADAIEEGRASADEGIGREQRFPVGNKVPRGGEQSSLVVNKVPWGGEQSSLGVGNKVPWGREQSSPNNIKGNIKDNITDSSSSSSETDVSLVPPVHKSPGDVSKMVEQVMEKWNGLQNVGIKPVSRISRDSARYEMLRARLREYGLEAVLAAVGNIARSKFLRGQNRNGWSIKFDWFVRPNNFPKVLEGNYDDADGGCQAGKGGSGYADTGQGSEGYSGGGSGRPGQGGGTRKYDPKDYFGFLMDV